MSKKQEIKSIINQYKAAYMKAADEVQKAKRSGEYTDAGMETKKAEISKRYNPLFQSYQERLVDLIGQTQKGMRAKNTTRTAKRLENAEKALFILKAIETGAMTQEGLRAVIPVFENDPLSLSTFRSALIHSDNEELQLMAADLPEDHSGDGIASLEKFKGTISRIPGADTMDSDAFAQAVYNNGTCFDDMAEYVERAIGE